MTIEYTPGDIVLLPCHVAIRRRPSLYLGERKSERWLWFVRDLLLSLLEGSPWGDGAKAREAFLTLEGHETVRLFSPGFTQTPERLMRYMRHLHAPGFIGLTVATAFSSRIQVDLWRDGRQWRVHGAKGFCITSARELHPAEPTPTAATHALRVECHLDPEFFGRRALRVKRLGPCLADVTARAPALRVHLVPPA